jgi:lipid A 3-O-deacylase
MPMRLRCCASIGALVLICLSDIVGAADASGDRYIGLAFENDLFAHVDDYYSNGVKLTYLSAKNDVWRWVRKSASLMPTIDADADMRVEHALGQEIYTPRDLQARPPDPNDRPYAGWLYYSLGVTAEKDKVLDQLQLTVGIVGPDAQAEAVQRTVHHLFGGEAPKGWDYQLKNEPGINVGYFRTWRKTFEARTDGYEFDLSPHLGGMIGNVSTYAAGGVTARFGRNLPLDYGLPRVQPSMPGGFYFEPEAGFHWYAFGGVAGRLVARNIFLEGNTFDGGPGVDPRPYVVDVSLGLVLAWSRWRIAYTHVLRTQEFDEQNGETRFGALSVSYRW